MVVGFWKDGGPAVRAAAEEALTGSDASVRQFLETGRASAEYQDDKEAALQIIAQGGRGLREAAEHALSGTPQELDAFLKEGWKEPLEQDQVVAAAQIANAGGRGVKAAGDAALNGSIEQVKDFLERVQFEQRDADDLVRVTQIENTGGPSTKRAASVAMNGTIADVRDFLLFGQHVARAQDLETATVSQLADRAKSAGQQAEQEAKAAKEACDQALSASRLAKEAAKKAAAETKLAEGDAARAGEAARRAAEATRRAADAAQAAITASRAANSAARLAASAAADAANAAAGASRAATRALSAAAAQKVDEGTIHEARLAAEKSALAGEWADRAAAAADAVTKMSDAVSQVTGNVNDAIKASSDADADASRAGAASGQSAAAAAAARRYLAEATRAAAASRQWAAAAAQGARDARDAARSSASHARAAADAAAQAATHAAVGAAATERARIHSEAAGAAATAATAAVDQAKKVYELARKAEAEEVAARTAAGRNQADDLTAAYTADQAAAAKVQAERAKLNDDFVRLAAQAGQPGADLPQVVTDSRRMAVTAMKVGGSWSRTAAEWALAGSESAVVAYGRTGWQRAQQQDEADQVSFLVERSPYEAVRKGASEVLKGDAARIHTFLETGQHEVALVDYQVEVTRISQAGGPGVKQAADNAFKAGTAKALVDFVTTTQYQGREADDRVVAARLAQTAGPEVKAAAEAAILSPPGVLRAFVQTDQYRAQRQDHLTTTHTTQVQQTIAESAEVAAKAQQNAAEAAKSYAIARDATQDANGFALEAQNSANRASEASKQAQKWATQAEQSAAKAAGSARAAAQARQRAADSANEASQSATWARASAMAAAGSAEQAYAAATAARESAERSGHDNDYVVTVFNEALENAKQDEARRQRIQRFHAELNAEMYQSLPPVVRGAITFANLPLQQKLQIAVELAHLGADVFGALPIVGTPVSLANCGTYALEAKIFDDASKYRDAAWSCAATIPIGGWAALGAKLEKWGVKTEKFRGALQRLWSTSDDLALPPCPARHSFPAGTPVLMANGTNRPIEKIEAGDLVTATDPTTGETKPRRVTRTIHTPDDRNFTEVTLGDGSVLTSTSHHPYWSESDREWKDAADLTAADTLRTPQGNPVAVATTRDWDGQQDAYDLTVDDLHTYYVSTGTTHVLVHNTDGLACPTWVVGAWEELGPSPRGVETAGVAFRPDGTRLWKSKIVSGEGGVGYDIDKFLQTSPDFNHPGAYLKTSHHAEAKFAWAMRNSGEKGEMHFVINKNYICPEIAGPRTMGCTDIIPAILYDDQIMRVFYRGGPSEGVPIPGVAKRKPGAGQ
ncbi:polymorphic toxin-type HINT domain-containing protein [Streptomyces virginiae]|uniref:polymorphic toxin-type HINT domain-containing protein n=1 Tax=Streptomyces virginiae TaxID=1961 RepID=UPI002F9146CB|nr:polymorphic toxin-type HINT domain-containing protein [Streptomyces virginiae]